jgi:hypothetical protein
MMPLSLLIEDYMVKSHRPPMPSDGGPLFIFDGNVLTHNEFQYFLANVNEPVIVAGRAVAEPNLVQLFDSRDAFLDWGQNTQYAFQFDRIEEITHRYRYSHPVKGTKLGIGLISNMPIQRKPKDEPVIWRQNDEPMATLFEGQGFSGREISVGMAAISDLGDLEFANVMSSAKVRGCLMLSDQVNFGGYRFYVTGDPVIQVPDMNRWGFDKAARSAVLI